MWRNAEIIPSRSNNIWKNLREENKPYEKCVKFPKLLNLCVNVLNFQNSFSAKKITYIICPQSY